MVMFLEKHSLRLLQARLRERKRSVTFDDLRDIVNYAYLYGIHDNDRAMQYFANKKIEESDKAIEIYLTEAELQALYDMPLSGKQDEVRDIFLVGCYTCQRVSDYNDIDKDCFTTTAKGTPVIRLV